MKQKLDSRLYSHMTRRLAKKRLGSRRIRKLNYAINLKPGDLISGCKGYNETIEKIEACWSDWKTKGCFIHDFDIQTVEGNSCSMISCCSTRPETRDEIYESWRHWLDCPDGQDYGFKAYAKKIEEARAKGEHAFDEDGRPYYDFCLHDWERMVRFPERWKEDLKQNFRAIFDRSWVRKTVGGKVCRFPANQIAFGLGITADELKEFVSKEPDAEVLMGSIDW